MLLLAVSIHILSKALLIVCEMPFTTESTLSLSKEVACTASTMATSNVLPMRRLASEECQRIKSDV